MDELPLITTPIREPNAKLWAIFNKKGPLTAEEQAYLDRVEAEYEEIIFDEGEDY
jgi:hypothetical protein